MLLVKGLHLYWTVVVDSAMDMFGANNSRNAGNDYTASSSVFDVNRLSWTSGIAWIAAVLFILLGILLFVHYTLYPIFQFQPGGKGLVPLPGFKDNRTFWQPVSPYTNQVQDISDDWLSSFSGTGANNWAFTLDISIMCPLVQIVSSDGKKPIYRVIFSRGGTFQTPTTSDTISGIIQGYNVAIALVPGTTDLIVSVPDTKSNPIEITLPNIIVNQPFRIGVCLMDNAFEVYLNGKLVQTSTIKNGINGNKGAFHGPKSGAMNQDMTQIVRVGNLNVWQRTPSPAELRYAQPSLMAAVDKDATCSIIGGGSMSCPSSEDTASGEQGVAN